MSLACALRSMLDKIHASLYHWIQWLQCPLVGEGFSQLVNQVGPEAALSGKFACLLRVNAYGENWNTEGIPVDYLKFFMPASLSYKCGSVSQAKWLYNADAHCLWSIAQSRGILILCFLVDEALEIKMSTGKDLSLGYPLNGLPLQKWARFVLTKSHSPET